MNALRILELAERASAEAQTIGLDVSEIDQLVSDAEKRLGLTGDKYVLALIGGTGVGKSTLLNALAGTEVSKASVLRPTTAMPTAWLHQESALDMTELLEWLEVDQVVEHQESTLKDVAIVDFPDIDSVMEDHRKRVDEAFPKLDAVIWVVDQDKYDDERQHVYLRGMGERARNVKVVLNKSDLVPAGSLDTLTKDVNQRVTISLGREVPVFVVSAGTGTGIDSLLEHIRQESDAKSVIVSQLAARISDTVGHMSSEVGHAGMLQNLDGHLERATQGALEIFDADGLARQTRTAYRERGRDRAGSLLGRAGGLLRMITGKRAREANPSRFAKGWHERGDLARVVLPAREAYLDAGSGVSGNARAGLMGRFDPESIRSGVSAALDQSASAVAAEIKLKTPWLWNVLATLQWVATVVFLLAIVWILLLTFGPGDIPVGDIDVPIVGPLPAPIVVLAGSLLASVIIAAVVGVHSSLIGARAGRRARKLATEAVSKSIDDEVFTPLREVEKARAALRQIAGSLRDEGLRSA